MPISRVVVTLPFGELSPEARAALHEAEENLRIRVEFFADYICGSERIKPAAAAPAVPPLGKMSADMAPAGVDAPAAWARRPYWRVKRVLDVVAATCAIVLLAPLLAAGGRAGHRRGRTARALLAAAAGHRRTAVQALQVPHHGAAVRCRRPPHRGRRPPLGDRPLPAPLSPRRAAAALQHPDRRDVVHRSAAPAPGGPVSGARRPAGGSARA